MRPYGILKMICCWGHTTYGKHKTGRWFNETSQHKKNTTRGAKKRARQKGRKEIENQKSEA